MKNPVFFISASVISILVVIGAVNPEGFGSVATTLFGFTTKNFGWFYLISVFGFVIFLGALALSKYGKIKIGPPDSEPEYPFFTWIGMLFSAGFGAGLVFWGVAEPMSHFFTTPFNTLDAQTEEAARISMGYSFFHWGINQWSVFAIVGLLIGFLQFRQNKSGLISTALEPVLGKNKGVKTFIDSLAVIATVMGIATSLGLGILQMNGGLKAVFDVPNNTTIQLAITAVLLVLYLASSSTGLNKGIKWLSNVNLGLCMVLLAFVFIAGPTVFILNTFTLGLGDYITNFVGYSLRLTPYEDGGGSWLREWTIFYWAWVIAWSPFVGTFVARVSRGRSIREFIFGVLIVPPLIACLWIATFGGTALNSDLNNGTNIAEAVNNDVTLALFETYQHLPMTGVLSILSILLIATFLITSADSATYILASMTTNGSLTPPLIIKIVWGVLMAAIAGVLLLAGGLNALQTASLVSALPFTIVIILFVYAFTKMIRKEEPAQQKIEQHRKAR
ncbi:glycine/betaine ABC transporter permease [Halobacillus halophilus]|uniref:BCCT family transporter n=1 Tax=Halobacillus halophilus (strain ATCC 35676 / DSM 2266 / JCM 20832 / KCTC 3685 / LMG 17431 / NBRC 102448 / NCIMB 2269) TaxID=866895 RepID=I0JHV5_HALH3|nr:BCCT family transporter [Halobacillus halophilus]ASF37926.1 glycine/betaine ABC transporter permease [Halobacillus halophilus]CCG43723.1 BCCT family transporter [Halobacillus halophilus DSM 2266]